MVNSRIWGVPFLCALVLLSGCDEPSAPAPFRPFRTDTLEGPVAAKVERVIDGDTIEVEAAIWLGQTINVRVRIDGIDAAEPEGPCDEERRLAELARDYLVRRLNHASITLTRVGYDKYGGRVRATVSDAKGNIGDDLIAAGLARPYHGERRGPWCAKGAG